MEWQNSRLVKGNIAGQILKRKQQLGKDMVIFGSGSIVSAFAQLGLIDEYRLIVNRVVLSACKVIDVDEGAVRMAEYRCKTSPLVQYRLSYREQPNWDCSARVWPAR